MLNRLNRKYGKLTVIDFAGSYKVTDKGRKKTHWVCRCACGNTITVSGDNLSSGNTSSCGCTRVDNISGQRFNRLLVLDYYEVIDQQVYWRCICDCGTEKLIRASSITTRHTKSCGCLLHETEILNQYRVVYTNYRMGARRRKKEFELTLEQFCMLVSSPCHYCGMENSNKLTKGGRVLYYNGIDRIDSNAGYTAGNVISCCKICNYAKRTMGYEEFKAWVRRVYNYMELGE